MSTVNWKMLMCTEEMMCEKGEPGLRRFSEGNHFPPCHRLQLFFEHQWEKNGTKIHQKPAFELPFFSIISWLPCFGLLKRSTFVWRWQTFKRMLPDSDGGWLRQGHRFFCVFFLCVVFLLVTWSKFALPLPHSDFIKTQCLNRLKHLLESLMIKQHLFHEALAVSGLSVIGRDKWGVFPLRGKAARVLSL